MGTLPQGRVSGNRTPTETVAVSLKAKVVQRKQGNDRRAGSIPAVPTRWTFLLFIQHLHKKE